jgi:hypothetical protein
MIQRCEAGEHTKQGETGGGIESREDRLAVADRRRHGDGADLSPQGGVALDPGDPRRQGQIAELSASSSRVTGRDLVRPLGIEPRTCGLRDRHDPSFWYRPVL